MSIDNKWDYVVMRNEAINEKLKGYGLLNILDVLIARDSDEHVKQILKKAVDEISSYLDR